jgi:branched-chain amino acid transport system permease protein
MVDFLQIVFNGVLTGLVYGIVALSFVVIYRASRIVNLAQGEVLLVGAFFLWTFTLGLRLPLYLGVGLALAASVGTGILLERAIFRPLIGQPAFAIVMASIGLMILLRGVVQVAWGAEDRPFPGILPGGAVNVGAFLFNKALLIGGVATLVLVESLHRYFLHTDSGLRLAAVAEDHLTALSMGVSVRRATTIAWMLGVSLAAVAAVIVLSGTLVGLSASAIGFRALPVALLGGLESVRGAPLAGVLIGVGEALASAYLDPLTNGAMSQVFPFLIMIGVLLIRPQGLFGWKIIERV